MQEWEQHEQQTRQTFKRDISQVDGPTPHGSVGETPSQIKVGVWVKHQVHAVACCLCLTSWGQERLLKMTETALPASAYQQQQQRGAGDWSNYQPPSAVLSAIAATGGAPRPQGRKERLTSQAVFSDLSCMLMFPYFRSSTSWSTAPSPTTTRCSGIGCSGSTASCTQEDASHIVLRSSHSPPSPSTGPTGSSCSICTR